MIRRGRYISPITLRIMAVNIGALLILAFGLIYTGGYANDLTGLAQKAIQREGRLLAMNFEAQALEKNPQGLSLPTKKLAEEILRNIAGTGAPRVLLFAKNGKLLLDSNELQDGPRSFWQESFSLPFSDLPFGEKISYLLDATLDQIPMRLNLEKFPVRPEERESYPGVSAALQGHESANVWYDAQGHVLLTASIPIQDARGVVGTIELLRQSKGIEIAVRSVQKTVLKLLIWALFTMLLLSLYLTETIGLPLLRLAEAAEKAEHSLLLKDSIPDFSYRFDEIGVLSAALRSMTTALAERINAIGNFAADVAHEIKNPLASLKSAIETFALVDDPERQKKLLAILHDDVERLDRLITDISNASRLDSEISKAPKSPFDLAPFLQEIVKTEAETLGLGQRLSLSMPKGKAFRVLGNEGQLGQVMDNLIQNAGSFLPADGKIALTCLRQKDKIIVHVDNNGPPIPDRKLETIFERFYSERPEREKFGLHSGLGLSISRQIVRSHKGAIFARNMAEKGRHTGVRFTIILPAHAT